jgi:hypothetical protein
MKPTMKQILKAILTMPYYRNYQAVSGAVHNISNHEDAVEVLLLTFGLKLVERKVSWAERDAWLINPSLCDMAEGTFVAQPCGKNSNPDFIVMLNGRVYFLECKSVGGSTKAPMYNSGIPKEKYIYIFCAERYNKTTIYFGKDVLPPDEYKIMMECIAEHRKVDEKYNPRFKNDFGINHYTRPMVKHVRGTDYFDNPHRKRIEQGVLDAV